MAEETKKPRKKATETKDKEMKASPKVKAITVTGKRKTAVAKATIKEGKGEIRINKKPIEALSFMRKVYLSEPLRIYENVMKNSVNNVDINVNVVGGGSESQVEASRLAIARSLVEFTRSKELKSAFTSYDRSLLVADVRRKEMRKPGDSKARARRQTSYR